MFAFFILPNEIEKVLYLDADTIIRGPIDKLYQEDISDVFVKAFIDLGSNKKHVTSLYIDHAYFNSGVMLMNFKLMREVWNMTLIERAINNLKDKLEYPDQDILNILIPSKKLKFFPNYRFNFQAGYMLDKEYDFNDILIIHYVGPLKPWNHVLLNKYEKEYWKSLKKARRFKLFLAQKILIIPLLIKRLFLKIKNKDL